jgi:hypothetical protein
MAGTIVLAANSLSAEPLRPIPAGSSGGVLSPSEVDTVLRSMRLVPASRPVREGQTYSVLATDPRGRQLRVVIDARFGDVLSVRRAIVAGPAAAPRPYAPYARPWIGSNFRPPGSIGRADPYQPSASPPRSRPGTPGADKPEQKAAATAAPVNSNAPVVTIGPSAAARTEDPKVTGSTSKASGFPPAQTLE